MTARVKQRLPSLDAEKAHDIYFFILSLFWRQCLQTLARLCGCAGLFDAFLLVVLTVNLKLGHASTEMAPLRLPLQRTWLNSGFPFG